MNRDDQYVNVLGQGWNIDRDDLWNVKPKAMWKDIDAPSACQKILASDTCEFMSWIVKSRLDLRAPSDLREQMSGHGRVLKTNAPPPVLGADRRDLRMTCRILRPH
jgi:hypothetical protein